MSKTSDITNGAVMRYQGALCEIVEFQRVSPGKGSSFVRTRLKNLSSGKVVEYNFKESDTVDLVSIARRNMQFLYKQGDELVFMDTQTYEQVSVAVSAVGESARFLCEGMHAVVVMFEDTAITVSLPKKVSLRVTRATDAVKGDSSGGNVTKEVELESGTTIRVPMFIKEGDKIAVNTDSCEYVERVKE